MVQRVCLVSLTISNRKTLCRSLKQTAGSTSCPCTTILVTSLQLVLCCVAALNYFPYIIHSADFILLQSYDIGGYILNKQKIIFGLDSCDGLSFLILWIPFDTKQSFNTLSNLNKKLQIFFFFWFSSPDHVRVTNEA